MFPIFPCDRITHRIVQFSFRGGPCLTMISLFYEPAFVKHFAHRIVILAGVSFESDRVRELCENITGHPPDGSLSDAPLAIQVEDTYIKHGSGIFHIVDSEQAHLLPGVRLNPEGDVFPAVVITFFRKFPDLIRSRPGIRVVIPGLGCKEPDQVIHFTPEFLKLQIHENEPPFLCFIL